MTEGLGATIFGCAGPGLLAEERAFFREANPFGFIVFARNVETPDQLLRLTSDLREAVGRDAPVLVDQEGGRVQRLRAPHWREWDPPLDTVERAGSVEAAERIMRLRAMVIAAELAAVGIDANCVPTLDVARAATHAFLRNRCYSTDPAVVSRIGRAVADGLMAGGVLPVMKHLPGHGLSQLDTHLDLPTVHVSLDELKAIDFAPFRALNDLPMAMTAHLVFAACDPGLPATQSPRMIGLIRDEIGFKGLLMSDDLNMQALKGTLAERTARTIAAGVDVALHCKGDMAEMQEVAAAAGTMTPAARARADAVIAARKPGTVDVAAALAELADG
ncbi:glycoside hydrolase family 3 N-terminal domain-containing protein [Tabrizicola sp.]|uniref:glycoside hydrolase family 3 N-terminal domain-containing protein n=1 Tax=Tabrizicola sp. TaxID=2005166 RepID=UPI003F411420